MTQRKDEVTNDGTSLEFPSEREILITRRFDAPARLVFDVLTRPEHVRRWWAPRSCCEMLSCEIDFRVGGSWRYVMRVRGADVGFHGEFLEIEPPRRIVNTEIFDPYPDAGAVVTVLLAEEAGQTLLSSRSLYPSREVRDQVIATGMEQGMRESLRQLSDVVNSLVDERQAS